MITKQEVAEKSPFRYCGRTFSLADIENIRRITDDVWCTTRTDIARAVCDTLHWVKPDGQPNLATCMIALNRMEEHGVIWLPLPTTEYRGHQPSGFTAACDPQEPITGSRGDLKDVHIIQVRSRTDEARLWNEFIQRYHYLRGGAMAGAQMRYLAYDGNRPLSALGFGAAALKLAPRDRFIGWTPGERDAKIHLVVGNRRFLVFPWVRVRGLASSLLSLVARRLPDDWQERYSYRPVLLESFTDRERHAGTSYAAANWVLVGRSQGLGRLAHCGQSTSVKDICLYPVDQRFRTILTDGRLGSTPGQVEGQTRDNSAQLRTGGDPGS